jgi:pimeloyl-ACP methyl ester carboxylesterase
VVRWCERLATFARLVRFDKRGTGMSDRPEGIPTPDERMEDARAVMDAARMDGVLRGISVHLAARVMAEAAGGRRGVRIRDGQGHHRRLGASLRGSGDV